MSGKEAAKEIRKVLKASFPGVKFSVTSDYSAVNIRYVDGPAYNLVESSVDKFEAGSFNGMEDIYEYYSESSSDVPSSQRVKYIFISRSISDENRIKISQKYNHIEDTYVRETCISKELRDISF